MVSRRAKVAFIEKTEDWKDEAGEQIFGVVAICCGLHCFLDSLAHVVTWPHLTACVPVLTAPLINWQDILHLQYCFHFSADCISFKNLAGLQILFWDFPMSHLKKQRRTMRNMALGASSWKSSCLRQWQNPSRMIQPIPSMKEMRSMKMKCIHELHFHMLLSCSELWEISKKRKGKACLS